MLSTDVAGLAAGPFVAACSLLALAGAAKIADPRPARDAISAAGWRVPRVVARGVGGVEIAVGVSGVVLGGSAALVVAVAYLVLAGFALRLIRHAPATPCACLGASSVPVSRVHVLVDLGAVAIALAAASGGAPFAPVAHRPFASAVFVVLVASCVKLGALTFDALPQLSQAMKEGAS